MNRDKKAEGLLNKARTSAINEIGQIPATPHNLELLATTIRMNIFDQCDRGQWDFVGINSSMELAKLKVECVIVFGKVHVQYDFTKTSIPLLKTWTERGLVVS